VIATWSTQAYDGDLLDAVQHYRRLLCGAYAIAVFCRDEPQRVVGAREGSPLVLGVGERGASNLPGQRRHGAGRCHRPDRLPGRRRRGRPATRQAVDHATSTKPGAFEQRERPVRTVNAHSGAAELGPYRHYMQKEIFEQPQAIADTLDGVGAACSPQPVRRACAEVFAGIDRVLILACGTSYYAAAPPYWLEALPASPPASKSPASTATAKGARPAHPGRHHQPERRNRRHPGRAQARPRLGHDALLTICNVATSAMVRECELAYITRAGVEIGVASTKAFTTQLVGLFLLTLVLAKLRGHLRRLSKRPP
jgi:glucosamine--fructose-6-phosphate aminotransferase (isomerizing)